MAVRRGVTEALGLIGPESMILVRRALRDSDPSVRIAAVEAVYGFAEEAAPVVADIGLALSDPAVKVREAAARTLGKIGPGAVAALPALILGLDDEEYVVRLAVLRALAGSHEDTVPVAIRAACDESSRRASSHCFVLWFMLICFAFHRSHCIR